MSDPKKIKQYLIYNTIRNIDSIAEQLNDGSYADKESMVKLVNRMLEFLDTVVSPGSVVDGPPVT